ncbi:DUF6477 family protein [Ruixingdingia sedimenti]|uniref:DUF6477 family protein n=1 Tax=Ruixingdingia sedimenti TaxID=3073604 RepID=A0ABU1F8R4_9RHOB|nr:DUF6477 family protein [Xinfangfangia sp. LG-4]MDR5653242.1 DUF6477 family protein [Xinfangfangia sp. LG-4]
MTAMTAITDLRCLLADLRRPRLLIRAARCGLADYRRDRDLPRTLGPAAPRTPETAFVALLDAEARLETIRQAGDATYSVTRHVAVLIALLAEARLLPRPA